MSCAKLGGGAEERSAELEQAKPAAAAEERLVPLAEGQIASSIGDDQHLEQGHRRGHGSDRPGVDGREELDEERQVARMFLDESDEDDRVDHHRPTAETGDQSHEPRSPSTW